MKRLVAVVSSHCKAIFKKNLDIKNLTVAVQGFGNVGSVGARLIAQAGAKVTVAIGDVSVNIYNPNGLDVEKAYEYANSHDQIPRRLQRTRHDYNWASRVIGSTSGCIVHGSP